MYRSHKPPYIQSQAQKQAALHSSLNTCVQWPSHLHWYVVTFHGSKHLTNPEWNRVAAPNALTYSHTHAGGQLCTAAKAAPVRHHN